MAEQDSYSKKILKGGLAVFISIFIATIFGYILRLYLSRVLSIEEFGLLYAIIAFFALFALFRDMGLNSAIVKYVPEFLVSRRNDKIKASITFNIIFQISVGLAIALPIIFFSDYIALSYFHTIEARAALEIFGVMFLIGVFTGVFQSCLQGFNRMDYYSIAQPISTISTLIAILALAYLGFIGVIWGFFISAIIVAFATFFLMLKTFPNFFRIKGVIDKKLSNNLLKFSIAIFIGGIGGYILGYTDTLILTYFRSLEEVAYYQVAWATTQVLWIIGSIVSTVMFPIISEIVAKKQKKLLLNGIEILTKIAFITILPFCLITIAFSDIIITFLFGAAYLPASVVLQILSIHALFYTLWVIYSTTLIGLGMPGLNTKIILAVSIFNLVGNLITVPIYGIIWAALFTTTSFAIAFVVSFYVLRKNIEVKFPLIDSFKAFFCGLLMLGIIFGLKYIFSFESFIEIIVLLVIGIIFYGLFILISGTINKKEVKMILDSGLPIPKFIIKVLSKMAR